MKERLIETLKWTERLYPVGILLWWLGFALGGENSTDSFWLVLAVLWLPINLVRWIFTDDCSIKGMWTFLEEMNPK